MREQSGYKEMLMKTKVLRTVLAVVFVFALNAATALADGTVPEPRCPPGQHCPQRGRV